MFIPRPETELLVEEVIKAVNSIPGFVVEKLIDIGTGCGNIAVSLGLNLAGSKVWAVDIDRLSISVARTNSSLLGLNERIVFLEGDLFEPLKDVPGGLKFDLIVSNPPYIAGNEIEDLQPEIIREPRAAVYGGKDGLGFYRRIVKESGNFLSDNGLIAFEIGYDQKEKVCDLLIQDGYKVKYTGKDYGGLDRIVIAMKSEQVNK